MLEYFSVFSESFVIISLLLITIYRSTHSTLENSRLAKLLHSGAGNFPSGKQSSNCILHPQADMSNEIERIDS
jgi:hypothetical protein